jgi:shikimate dehydrogenase
VAACDGVSKSLTVINRNPDREKAIRSAARNSELEFRSWDTKVNFNEFDLVVNTTPGAAASVFLDQISSGRTTVFEVLYNPWPTQLLSHWRKSGGFGIDGLDLLIHQAISQIEIFAARTLDRDLIAQMLRQVGEKALS